MQKIKSLVLALVMALTVVCLLTTQASARVIQPLLAPMQGGTDLAECLSRANSCEEQLSVCIKEKDRLTAEYKDLADKCLAPSTTKKAYGPIRARVQSCTGEAQLVNGRCDCDHIEPLPGRERHPVPVKTQMANGDLKWTCVWEASEVRASVSYLVDTQKRVCEEPDKMTLDDSPPQSTELCEQTGINILKMIEMLKGTDLNGILSLIEDEVAGLCALCGCRPGESAVVACVRYRQQDAEHEAAQDEAIRQLGLFQPGWFIGPSLMGVYRGEAPASFNAGLKIGFHSPVSENVVLAASGLFGYAKSKQDRFLAGGEFEGFLALNDAKSVSFVFGALGTAEVVYEGVLAWTVPAKLGVGFHGDSIGGQLFLGAGPTYVSVPNEDKGSLGLAGVLGGQFYFDLMPHLKYNPPPPPSAVSASAGGST